MSKLILPPLQSIIALLMLANGNYLSNLFLTSDRTTTHAPNQCSTPTTTTTTTITTTTTTTTTMTTTTMTLCCVIAYYSHCTQILCNREPPALNNTHPQFSCEYIHIQSSMYISQTSYVWQHMRPVLLSRSMCLSHDTNSSLTVYIHNTSTKYLLRRQCESQIT